ncbi:MAG: M23 family metallopeptidase [Clostridiales Family XIII bacterium]|jgi:murein DD-endopeptidase MepM/ murein hydrolase activator NlpD|nr:M23 family metallopeptidase [Clostridiales Family XIII bacterium]
MRRFFFVVLIAVFGLVGYGVYSYTVLDWRVAPDPQTTVMGTRLAPTEAEWHAPLFKGLLRKSLHREDPAAEAALGPIGQSPLALSLTLPQGFTHHVRLLRYDVPVLDEAISAWEAPVLEAGEYALEIRCSAPEAAGEAYGGFLYRCGFTVEPKPDPMLLTGRLELEQGDIVSLRLLHVPPEILPRAETELGMAIFTPDGENAWYAAIPVGNTQSPGRYEVLVRAGDNDFVVAVTVLPFDFVEQDLIVDTEASEISESSSPAAYREYREKIPPLFDTYDAERYWHGLFMPPTTGAISTEFGTVRYTNGDRARPRIHNGMDIAAREGTPVFAPNAGRVVMAERLLNTGNTVVLEHGGGMKSYYFHLSRIDAAPGDMVEKGAPLGAVGSTGYSTGPHLHYEIRIGNRPVNPAMFLAADAGLYSAANAPLENAVFAQ